ncbi:hypothetical protein BBP40_007258 [Aspergillus hancockii]|nr:hypothetical protein BBP40_007258 [Aspergillus hancockii]
MFNYQQRHQQKLAKVESKKGGQGVGEPYDDVDETSSDTASQSREKRSTFNNAGLNGLDEVSLNFDDPPNLERLEVEIQELKNIFETQATTFISREAEWGFVPSVPYDGHSQDRILQSLMRKYLSTHVEELGTKQEIDREIGVSSTQVELQTICDWISPMDFIAKHERILTMRQKGTCEWFIQSQPVTDFIAHTGTVLWAVGIPGSGKTVLSSAIIDYLTHFTPSLPDRAAVAYAYCDHRMQESQTTLGLVACFLRQLLEVFWEVNKMIPDDVQAIFDLHKEARTSPSMADCLKMLATVIEGCASVFLVIDALDECSPTTRQELIDTIRFLVVHFLVQSWADNVQRFGAGPPSLSLISGELDAFYGGVVMRIIHEASPNATLARQALVWVAFSRRPLTVSEITDVISAEVASGAIASCHGVPVGSELLTTICAGTLIVDSKIGTLRLAHVTLQEYLQRNREKIFARSQEYITASCVKYLSLEEFKEGPCTNNQAMLARLQQHPFLHYAATEWGYHALGTAESACKDAIITFLSNRFTVESAIQAKNMPRDWRFYPQSIDSSSYPIGVAGIALAAFFGLATIVEAMLDNSGNEDSYKDNEKALFWAAMGGSVEVIKLLLTKGTSPNVSGVMRAAAENGHEHSIRILVANGGDVNAESYEDEGNALQVAAMKGDETLIRCLLELGADPNRGGGELGSVLHIAAVNGDESITQLLLENGADPNAKGGMYGFALQAAVEEGHGNIIRMLLDNGAEVNLEGGPYGNAFQAAVENGDIDIVELLLAHGADINTMIGGEKYTALQEVARRGLETMVEFLIDKGANVDSRQRNGQTALHQAAKEGQAGVVALLLRKGANHYIRDQRGFRALDWAKKKNFSEVASILETVTDLY